MYTTVKNVNKSETNGTFTRQGSLRKVIPPEHKDNLFGRQNEDLNKFYKTYRQEYIILAEYKMIQTEVIQGVYVIPSRESALLWFGVVFVRNGPYEDGIFRFTIILDENFPDSEHPKVVFQSEIFHPAIHPDSNELHLLEAFPTWNKNEQHLWQVLKYIQWIFGNIEASTTYGINKEAVMMIKENKESFKIKAQELVKLSQEHIYDDPPTEDKHYITFEKYNSEIHDKSKSSMFSYAEERKPPILGHSWVLPGSFTPLKRPPSIESDNGS